MRTGASIRVFASAIVLAAGIAARAEAPDAGVAEADAPVDPRAALPVAQPISYKAALEKAQVGLAEPFGYTIELRHVATDTYALPAIIEWKAFHAREQTTETTGDATKTTTFRFKLQAFDVGELEVPAIRLLVKTADGPRQLEIPPQKLKVDGVIDATQGDPKLREDRRPLPRAYRTVLWPLYVLLALIAWVVGVIWWSRRAMRPLPAPPPLPRLPPAEEAIQRLVQLERDQLVARGEKQAYFFRLSEIARDYLGRRYGFDALESTTGELLDELRKRSTPGLRFDDLTDFLESADLVKFARIEPTDGQCKGAIEMVRGFVERTRPLAAPPVNAGGAR